MSRPDPIRIEVTRDVPTCQALRKVVFIDEQGVSQADEVDGLDGRAIHLLAWDEACPVGTARLLVKGATGKIGRVCVLQSARGKGIGADLIRAAVARFRGVPGIAKVKLGAQVHALGFYAGLGFAPVGEEYLDAGIVHRDMVLTF